MNVYLRVASSVSCNSGGEPEIFTVLTLSASRAETMLAHTCGKTSAQNCNMMPNPTAQTKRLHSCNSEGNDKSLPGLLLLDMCISSFCGGDLIDMCGGAIKC